MSIDTPVEVSLERRRKGFLQRFLGAVLRFAQTKPIGFFGAIVIVVALITGVFAPQIARQGYNKTDIAHTMEGPSLKYWFGTDQLGRDLFSRMVWGARVSVIIGFSVITLATLLSLSIGAVAAFVGGRYDDIVLRFVDAFLTFPTLVITLTLVAILGQSVLTIIAVLSFSSGIHQCRITRSAVLAIKSNQYMEAARAIGASPARIFAVYVLPNIFPIVIILATAALGGVILAEASLSFLGFGVPPPQPTWGGMLTGASAHYMTENFWLALWPGLALSLVVYAANMLGDALRDVMDPRLRGSR